jgi:hypothetical protein
MPDEPTQEPAKTPEQIAAEAAAAQPKAPVIDAATAAEIGKAVAAGLAEAEAKKAPVQTEIQEPAIETIDPNEIDRRIKAGEPIADLIAKFGAGVEERTRRAVLQETSGAVGGLQEVVLAQARASIEHFAEYEDEITKIVNRVAPAKRTLKIYQDATAMVLGRPDVAKKLRDAAVQVELDKVLKKPKESAGAAETGGATRVVRSAAGAQREGALEPSEENLAVLVGDDAAQVFREMKRTQGWTLDSFAQRQGYSDAKSWFDRMQENDRRSQSGDIGMDANWVRGADGKWVKQGPWVTGISR